MRGERVVGWVCEGDARHPVTKRAATRLGCRALAYVVRSPLGTLELLLLPEPRSPEGSAGRRVDTATVLRPGESWRGDGAPSGLRFVLAAEFGTASECGVDRCGICRSPLGLQDEVARCPSCGVVACTKPCASARQCTQCGASLEECWL
jgi:hypothetical protein